MKETTRTLKDSIDGTLKKQNHLFSYLYYYLWYLTPDLFCYHLNPTSWELLCLHVPRLMILIQFFFFFPSLRPSAPVGSSLRLLSARPSPWMAFPSFPPECLCFGVSNNLHAGLHVLQSLLGLLCVAVVLPRPRARAVAERRASRGAPLLVAREEAKQPFDSGLWLHGRPAACP